MSAPAIRVAIADDEPVARRTVRALLEPEADVTIVAECRTGAEVVALLSREKVDVLFLDIRMPGLHGFEALSAVPADQVPFVVFVTAHDEYALRAFDFDAVDYLLKPFDDDRFGAALRRIRERVAEKRLSGLGPDLRQLSERLALMTPGAGPALELPSAPAGEDEPLLTRLVIRSGKRIEFVAAADVDWIEADDYCVRVHAGSRVHLLRESLTRLESRLDPEHFVRVHRSAIVRIDRVAQLLPQEHGDGLIVLRDQTRIRVSRTRRRQVNRVLGLD